MNWKKILYKVIFPPIWVVALFAFLCIAGMGLVIINGFTNHPVYYAIYAISFYAVCIVTASFIKNCSRTIKKNEKQGIQHQVRQQIFHGYRVQNSSHTLFFPAYQPCKRCPEYRIRICLYHQLVLRACVLLCYSHSDEIYTCSLHAQVFTWRKSSRRMEKSKSLRRGTDAYKPISYGSSAYDDVSGQGLYLRRNAHIRYGGLFLLPYNRCNN